MHANHLIWGKEMTLQETRFFLLLYKASNAKKKEKEKSWKKLYMEKKKTRHLSVFVLLTHQTAKTHKKKKKISKKLQEKYFFSVFLSLLGTKTSKCMHITRYWERKRF